MAVLTKGPYNCSCSREVCDWSCVTYATMMSDKVPNTAIGYVPPLKKTNADRIRAMTDEELAFYIVNHPMWSDTDACVEWLKQEVDNG